MGDCVSSPFLNAELINSPNPYSKLDSYDRKQELEKKFCRDFACCGLQLNNLHQLLEHYEEYHLAHNNSNCSGDEDKDQLHLKSMIAFDPMQAESFMQNNSTPPPKKHLTIADLNMLENAQKYASRTKVQTLGTIVDGLPTPSLSPSESAVYESQCFEQEASSTKNQKNNYDELIEKPYRCQVEDCDKAYKNANGLKYHRLHGHCPPSEGSEALDANKPYTCSLGNCRKRYKNLNGLKYHMEHTHAIKMANLTSDMFLKNDTSTTSTPSQQEEQPSIPPHGLKRRLSSSSLSSASSYQTCL
ncbi:Transcriptional regulator of ribosomal biogenesis proteins [Mucor circinelloides]